MSGGNRIILSFGSNRNREQNMKLATELLCNTFADIRFSERIETEPYGNLTGAKPFLNQVAIAHTPLSSEEIICRLKEMEREIGRYPEDKSLGIIPIDIDLLKWNDTIIKAHDLHLEYIKSLLIDLLGN